jgi:hypothetical protein
MRWPLDVELIVLDCWKEAQKLVRENEDTIRRFSRLLKLKGTINSESLIAHFARGSAPTPKPPAAPSHMRTMAMEMIDEEGNKCISGTMDGALVLARFDGGHFR